MFSSTVVLHRLMNAYICGENSLRMLFAHKYPTKSDEKEESLDSHPGRNWPQVYQQINRFSRSMSGIVEHPEYIPRVPAAVRRGDQTTDESIIFLQRRQPCSLRLGTINIPIDERERAEGDGSVSDNEILLLVKSYLKIDWGRGPNVFRGIM